MRKKLHESLRAKVDRRLIRRIKSRGWGSNSIDVGCGIGTIGTELGGMSVDFPEYDAHNLRQFQTDQFDLVICTNVLEHLHSPQKAIREFRRIGRRMYLCWTPWYSPFGGHEFSPKHFFGTTGGSIHSVGLNLFKTTSDEVFQMVIGAGFKILDVRPRYYPTLKFLTKLPVEMRDFMCWNIEIWAE